MRTLTTLIVLVLTCASAARASDKHPSTSAPVENASAGQTTDALDPDAVSIHGFASFAGSLNGGRPASGANQLRVFDTTDRQPAIDVVELVLQKPATKPGAFGFRTDIVTGGAIPRVSASSGLFRDPATGAVHPSGLDVQQAYASMILPLGLRVDVGKFVTHVGAEVIEGFDGFGDNYSHSFLFGYAEPFTHTGVRTSYAFGPRVAATVMVVNGWDNVIDNNRGKTFGAQLALTPTSQLALTFNYLGGPERPDSSDARHLADVVAVIKAVDGVTVTASYDYGYEVNAAGPGAAGRWQGISASTKLDFDRRYSLAVRGEVFADPAGVRTGAAQTLAEVTLTPWITISRHVIVRTEFRADRSTASVFDSSHGSGHEQATAALNVLLVF